MKKIFIIGAGMGREGLLTKESNQLLLSCDEIYAFDRLAELFSPFRKDIIRCSYAQLIGLIKDSKALVIGILVSGDTGFFSIAKTLTDKLGVGYELESTCGINSLQYLCSKLKLSYENIKIISLHGRNNRILGSIAYNRYVFVLTGGANNASDILKELLKAGLGEIEVTAGEKLSISGEKIISGSVLELSNYIFDDLTVLLFKNIAPSPKEMPFFDEDFIRSKTPMTKQEVRWASVNCLKIMPSDIIFDIGAGTGSVSMEMGRKAYDGLVYAIEKEEASYELLKKNQKKLSAFNVIPIKGDALLEIKKLPTPNKVFVGGSSGELESIIQYLYELNPNIIFVVNAITIETLLEATKVFKALNFKMNITCLNCSRNKAIGDYNLMIANNPVYIIVGEKNAQ